MLAEAWAMGIQPHLFFLQTSAHNALRRKAASMLLNRIHV